MSDTDRECPRCGGTGRVRDDAAIGRRMRDLRIAADLTLRKVADRMELSAAYVSDLELGRRPWRAELEHRYIAAVG